MKPPDPLVRTTDHLSENAGEKDAPMTEPAPSVGIEDETFEKCSILFKVKESENFNHRNIMNISRIEI
jgi:hypothetical protein